MQSEGKQRIRQGTRSLHQEYYYHPCVYTLAPTPPSVPPHLVQWKASVRDRQGRRYEEIPIASQAGHPVAQCSRGHVNTPCSLGFSHTCSVPTRKKPLRPSAAAHTGPLLVSIKSMTCSSKLLLSVPDILLVCPEYLNVNANFLSQRCVNLSPLFYYF